MLMKINNTIYSASTINFGINDIADRREARKVLLCTPDHFDIVDVKNPYMNEQAGSLDKVKSQIQWFDLKKTYKRLQEKGILEEVVTINGVEGCEDMVFCANQTFPWTDNEGNKTVIMSKMKHTSRQREVIHFENFFKKQRYKIAHLKKTNSFEGMGDAIPHFGKRLLYGGYGHRTDLGAYHEISELLQMPIVPLELPNPKFYHLDTCFLPLDQYNVMLCKEAFTNEGIKIIHSLFKNIFPVSEKEAGKTFCLNAHVINDQMTGKKAAILQQGSVEAKKILKENGFEIIETDTSEYMKSGGSVFCMKMMFY